jgi:tetratricopeptide (TPR) repeat protein
MGRYFWNLRSVAGMQRSITYFQRVIALAPRNALGDAALADAYTELADLEKPCRQCGNWERKAKLFAYRALSVDPSSAEAHVAYGMVARVFHNDERTAAREFRFALLLDPDSTLANQWYGNLLIAQGELSDGVRHLQFAAREEPISSATYAWLARGYYYERRYTAAQQYALDALALQPNRLETIVLLGFVEEARGEYPSALRHFTTASHLGLTLADAKALQAGVDAAMGRRTAAIAELDRLAARQDLDIFALRDVVIGFVIAKDVRAAEAIFSRIRFHTPIDRELITQDPHIRPLLIHEEGEGADTGTSSLRLSV